MSPEWQTVFTLAMMGGTWWWGHYYGRISGIRDTLLFLEEHGDLTITEEIIEIEDEEDE